MGSVWAREVPEVLDVPAYKRDPTPSQGEDSEDGKDGKDEVPEVRRRWHEIADSEDGEDSEDCKVQEVRRRWHEIEDSEDGLSVEGGGASSNLSVEGGGGGASSNLSVKGGGGKAIPQLQQHVRMMMAGWWGAYLVTSSSALTRAADKIGRAYNERRKELGAGTGLSRGMVFVGAVEAAAEAQDEDSELAAKFKLLFAALDKKSWPWIETAVWFFSSKRMYPRGGLHKVQVGFDPFIEWDLEGLPASGISQAAWIRDLLGEYTLKLGAGGEIIHSPPPNVPLNHIVQDKLRAKGKGKCP